MNTQTKKALYNLRKAMYELNEAWSNETYEVSDELAKKYPFAKDFESEVSAIGEWVESLIDITEVEE